MRKRISEMPWADVLLANGFLSLLIGLFLLWLVATFSGDMHSWITNSSPTDFGKMLRFLVLLYLTYALSILLVGLVWAAWPNIKAKLGRPKPDNSRAPQIPESEREPKAQGNKSDIQR